MNAIIKQLSEQEIAAVQKSTEDVLERAGFRVTNAELRRLCRKAGARVDDARETVCFPAALLRELLSAAPKTYKIAAMDFPVADGEGPGSSLCAQEEYFSKGIPVGWIKAKAMRP